MTHPALGDRVFLARAAVWMWHRKIITGGVLLLASTAAGALTFTISGRGVHPRPLSFGVAATRLLVSSGDSPLADASVLTYDIQSLASDYAEIIRSSQVVDPVAAALHIRPAQIAASSQLVQDVPLADTDALEAQRGEQIIDAGRHYALLARVDQNTFVVQLFAQAPTGREAVIMATVAARAVSSYASSLVRLEHIPRSRAVSLINVEPPYGGTVDASLPYEAGVLFAIAFFLLGMAAVSTVLRWRGEFRAP